MQFISNDVSTVAMGLAASMGQFLLAAGTPGKRYALPHARIMMHQPSGGIGGSASDIKIQAQQSILLKKQLNELQAQHTGQSVEQVELDADRDRWFTPSQAKEYGFIDKVISSVREVGQALATTSRSGRSARPTASAASTRSPSSSRTASSSSGPRSVTTSPTPSWRSC